MNILSAGGYRIVEQVGRCFYVPGFVVENDQILIFGGHWIGRFRSSVPVKRQWQVMFGKSVGKDDVRAQQGG
ncbi:hypothetical protein [Spirosoma flavum]|uniref:Uncharacterized protein n=1 Tax=Spirosoma flavum TaxID=2048557 RepID=A0ABW6AEM0_9BACT